MTYRVGVDIGGTFTDFCAFDEKTRRLQTLKVLSRPDRPGEEVVEGLRQLKNRFDISPGDISYFTHGTTVGVNAVIQRKGALLALLVTEKFDDILELARLKTSDPYDLGSRRPAPLISKERIFQIRERTRADGVIDTPLREEDVRRAVNGMKALGIEAVVIVFLHSYRNAKHERDAKALINVIAPDIPVYCSSDIWPVIREYERTTTSVINGYVQPRVSHYLTSLQAALRDNGCPATALVTKSNGGIMTAENGKSACVQMILSGTASGVIGASYIARQCNAGSAMSIDIGGTSADVALIVDGMPQYGVGERIGDFPIYIPTVSVTSIGAGGGSIAWVDAQGVLKVGPESAGSTPGPVCYDRGGVRPAITDAFAVCGLIGKGDLGYSAVQLNTEKAYAAISQIGTKLGLNAEETAEAIIRIAVSGMYMEVSMLLSRFGMDPRELTLIAFGGAGPMLTCFLARELGVRKVIVPATPGVLSAFGGLVADLKCDFIKSVYVEVDAAAPAVMAEAFKELHQRAIHWLRAEQGYAGDEILTYSADMRYKGQSFEIEVILPTELIRSGNWRLIADAFHGQHRKMFDYADEEATIQLVNLRLVIAGATPKPEFGLIAKGSGKPVPIGEYEVWLDGATRRVPFYRREDLLAGHTFLGPTVVIQSDTTTCIPPGFSGVVDAHGNMLLQRDGSEGKA